MACCGLSDVLLISSALPVAPILIEVGCAKHAGLVAMVVGAKDGGIRLCVVIVEDLRCCFNSVQQRLPDGRVEVMTLGKRCSDTDVDFVVGKGVDQSHAARRTARNFELYAVLSDQQGPA